MNTASFNHAEQPPTFAASSHSSHSGRSAVEEFVEVVLRPHPELQVSTLADTKHPGWHVDFGVPGPESDGELIAHREMCIATGCEGTGDGVEESQRACRLLSLTMRGYDPSTKALIIAGGPVPQGCYCGRGARGCWAAAAHQRRRRDLSG